MDVQTITDEDGLSDEQKELIDEIDNGMYDVIISTAASWKTIGQVMIQVSNETKKGLCIVLVPDYTHRGWGREFATIIYSDKSNCPIAAKVMAVHYQKIMPKICEMSPRAGEVVSSVMKMNRYDLGQGCSKGPIDINETERLGWLDIFLASIGFVLCVLYSRAKS